MRATLTGILALTGSLLASAIVPITAGDPDPRFPGTAWETRTPAQLGLDGPKLDAIASLLGGDGMVVFDGYIVKQWGTTSVREDWASAGKPVIATLLMFAVDEGFLASSEAPILDTGWPLIQEDHPITYASLANQTSGYTRIETHEEAWAYNDYGIQLLVKTLFDRVYHATPQNVAMAGSRLGALQFQDGGLFSGGETRVHASVRDFARVAWLWLHHGQWNGTQLLPREIFESHRTPQVAADLPTSGAADSMGDYLGVGTYGGGSNQTPYGPGIYGFGWWFNGFGPAHPASRTWPDAPADTFQANGNWGLKVVNMIPSQGVVLLHRDSNAGFAPGSSASSQNQALKLLVQALRPRPFVRLAKSGTALTVEWSADCNSDHAVYEGQLGQWTSHLPVRCSDVGSDRKETLPLPTGNRYYLVVPRSGTTEGSYGRDSFDDQRPRSTSPCVASQNVGYCP